MNTVAYLRREKEIIETDFPIDKVWEAIGKTILTLDWTAEENDDKAHKLKIKTRGAFLSYSSVINVEVVAVKENTTRVNVSAETPVTTLTGIVDFGRTRERIDTFLMAMMSYLTAKPSEAKAAETVASEAKAESKKTE